MRAKLSLDPAKGKHFEDIRKCMNLRLRVKFFFALQLLRVMFQNVMGVTIDSISKLHEIQDIDEPDSPYLFDRIFPTGNSVDISLSKKKLRLLKAIDSGARRILRPGEQVFFITQGVCDEFAGTRATLIFTNIRIVLMGMRARYEPTSARATIACGDIGRVKNSVLGYLLLKSRNNQKILFNSIPFQDRKHIKRNLDEMLRSRRAPLDVKAAFLTHLCPRCYAGYSVPPDRCDVCKLEFRKKWKAMLLNATLPGQGEAYLGNKIRGAYEIVGYIVIWLIGLSLFQSTEWKNLEEAQPYLVLFLVFILIVHLSSGYSIRGQVTQSILPENDSDVVR